MAKEIKPKRLKGRQSPVIPLPPRAGAETMMADLSRIMQEQEFANLDDAQRFMNRLLEEGGGRIPLSQPQSPAERAQDLAYQAWDAPTDRKAAALAPRWRFHRIVPMPTTCWLKRRQPLRRRLVRITSKVSRPASATWARSSLRRTRGISGA